MTSVSIAASRLGSYEIWNLFGENIDRKILDLAKLMQEVKPTIIHFEWLHDFEGNLTTIDTFCRLNGISWTSVGSISQEIRSGCSTPFIKEITLLAGSKNCMGIFVFDHYILSRIPSIFPTLFALSDYQDNRIEELRDECCDWVSDKKRPVIGIVGQLYSYRGVSQLVKKFIHRPNFAVFLAGKYQPSSFKRKTRFIIWILSKTKKVYFEPEWISTSGKVNHKIKHLDAIYISSRTYRGSSGIAHRARQLGVPVIIDDVDSYLRDEMREDGGIGFFHQHSKSSTYLKKYTDELAQIKRIKNATLDSQIDDFLRVWRNRK